ncbi:hypothetical protein PZE06_06845 [Robertmurraya sp. DFI.2.37]|uniref:hypothetical protein n=1 Tax=Robertmurraya sp. DFI.2.37 TaxID=3031819 RepID=UPI001246BD80|nr:hypothetical protein [Robertmurraya sp. DFI.2.37]MDF1507899.1 hypothetical protein [Robertmurraya sp. DFI.2.37]
MEVKKILMILGAAMIILFIGWFYIAQLHVPEVETEDDTIEEQVENSASNIKREGIESSIQRTGSQGTVQIQVSLIHEKILITTLF